MKNREAIGVIDSGVGGLTVVKEALRQLPNETIIYVGDTARCPYGPRPVEQVVQYTWEMTTFLLKKKIKMLVIACNTATAVALQEIKNKLEIPVVGVILPGSRAALKATSNQHIGVIGTKGTIKSEAYRKSLENKTSSVTITSLACPKFAPIVESNEFSSPIAKMLVAETLLPMRRSGVDTLILGCTHYPLLRPIIQNVMGKKVILIDSGAETVSEVSALLDYFEIANLPSDKVEPHQFYTTGSPKMFEKIASDWLGLNQLHVEKIHLGNKRN